MLAKWLNEEEKKKKKTARLLLLPLSFGPITVSHGTRLSYEWNVNRLSYIGDQVVEDDDT